MASINVQRLLSIFRSDVEYSVNDGRIYVGRTGDASDVSDGVDRVKFSLKQFPRLYYALIALIAPLPGYTTRVRRVLRKMQGIRVGIGSGNRRLDPDVVNVDYFDYENVDVVCDIHDLPFSDGTIGGVVNVAVLEHVRSPAQVVAEVHRVLQPGGEILSIVPFMQPFHASPHDYTRYTLPGLRDLHAQFDEIDSGVFDGPVAGLLWVAQEALATMLCFGSARLRMLLAAAFMAVSWPLKWADLLFRGLAVSETCASTFYFHGRRRDGAGISPPGR